MEMIWQKHFFWKHCPSIPSLPNQKHFFIAYVAFLTLPFLITHTMSDWASSYRFSNSHKNFFFSHWFLCPHSQTPNPLIIRHVDIILPYCNKLIASSVTPESFPSELPCDLSFHCLFLLSQFSHFQFPKQTQTASAFLWKQALFLVVPFAYFISFHFRVCIFFLFCFQVSFFCCSIFSRYLFGFL